MSCSPFNLNDYTLGELGAGDRREVERHAARCAPCGLELERLRATRAALLSVADEEMPRRIGFVSDKIFEPSPVRRWAGAFWGSAARLGFVSAAMLSAAILVHAFRPMPAPAPVTIVRTAAPDHAPEIQAVVARAVAETEAREAKRTRELLSAFEKRHEFQDRALMIAVQENMSVMQKRLNTMTLNLASADVTVR